MTSVTLNGNTYNDGVTGPGNLGNGGHRTNLMPMLADAVIDLSAKAALATSNGATQVALAENQVVLATAQVALAEAKVTIATTQAGIATEKAILTAQDAAAAAISAANAAALFDQFDDKWLGAKSADPTLDNDGNALTAGALYLNTVTGYVRAYTGSAWTQGISVIAGVSTVNGLSGAVSVQPTLVAGTNIKTINGVSLLGGGDISIAVVPHSFNFAQGVL